MLHNQLQDVRSSINKTEVKNRHRRLTTMLTFFVMVTVLVQAQTIPVDHFDKVIVSPHIEVTFIQGDKEAVTIEELQLPKEKLNIDLTGNTLHIYLEGAKTTTKHKKVYWDNYKRKEPIYRGTQVKATITYIKLDELSLRGEEKFVCESPIKGEKFKLKIYGEPEVYIHKVKLQNLLTTIYGDSRLEIKEGSIENQKITSYGESTINTLGVDNKTAKITCYGETDFKGNVSDRLKVTAFGEATISYKGNPNIDKGIVIGEATIQRVQ